MYPSLANAQVDLYRVSCIMASGNEGTKDKFGDAARVSVLPWVWTV